MRTIVSIAIILLSLQCSAVVYKGNHGRKRKNKNLETVKYQEHRDVSLLYGATKEFEDSRQPTEKHLNDYHTVTPKSINHHVNRRMRVGNGHVTHDRSVSDREINKEAMNTHRSALQNQESHKKAPIAKVRLQNSGNSTKGKPLSVKSRGDEESPSIKRHKIPSRSHRHQHTRARKRTKVEEALRKERQNIDKTIDSLEDLPGPYSRGVDMDGMDIDEVTMIDNSTLSDYFHALNDNGSNRKNNNNNNNDASVYTPTTSSPASKMAWDDITPSDTDESNSGSDDDFYDAIDNGEEPPPVKMKKVRPTKSHFNKYKSKSNNDVDSTAQNIGSASHPSNFRAPSQEDFENFFQGMLDHFGTGRRPNQAAEQDKSYKVNNQETPNSQSNVTAFLDDHDGRRHGNVTKLVSLGSPERVDVMQQHDFASNEDVNPTFFNNENAGREREQESMASFLPPATPTHWMRRPLGDDRRPQNEQPLQEPPPSNFGNPPFTLRIPLPMKQINSDAVKQQDATLSPVPFKGTRIMGGKISGGKISGGVIQGGQIKAGFIEGGVIKGGQVVGGHITNGTMDGGVVAKGQMSGGHLVNGRIEGGKLLGGSFLGGRLLGGSVEGGEMKGGVVTGGRFRGGSMQGGMLKGGEVEGGTIKGGKVEGGILHGGNIEGGEFKFGDISGGTLKAGAMLGGVLKNGSIEGGTLKGGTIEGGVLKGGVMEGGHLKGGLVLAGKIKGGIIEGGVIEGGEIGDGVLITGGKVNATIIGTGSSMDKNQKLGGLFKQGENSQQLGLKVDQQKNHHGGQTAEQGSKVMSDSLPSTHGIPGLNEMHPNVNLKIPLREGTLKMLPQERDSSDDESLEKLLMEGKSAHEDSPGLSASQRFFEEQDQPSRVVQKKSGKHHVEFDGVGFDLPNEDFVDLIDKMKNEDLINYYKQPETKLDVRSKDKPKPTKSVASLEIKNAHIKPEDLERKLSFPTRPRSSVIRSNKGKSHHDSRQEESVQMKAVKLNLKNVERLRPTYHWSLNKLIKDRIPGSPGPAIRTHGEMKAIRGGLHLNGHNAWLGAGDFSGGCISDPDTCEDGLSFEMTFRLDKEALKYNDMNYIVDSGASTFNSKGFSLYTVQGNLRADLAIANQEFCLQIPVTVRKWQDILVTWKKSEGMKMYVNCELKGHTKGSEHCIGCHSKGCHMTDTNTLLMIGRPNYSPHFHCTKFDSGDISFWEKYLSAKDVETLCGAPTGETESNIAPLPNVIPEINQVKFPQQTIKQVAFPANPLQSYIANQPYFNRFTGLTPRTNDMTHQLFTPWSTWSACSKTCGVGVRARRRSCINPTLFPILCSGISLQHKSCFDRVCPAYPLMLPGAVLAGQQSSPLAYNQASLFSGFHYPSIPDVNIGTEPPLSRTLTVDGGYSEWSDWGTCDRSCGGGAQVRTRICNRPIPSGGGKRCHAFGPAIQVRRCNRKGCPVDGGYSPWSEFGSCSQTCGTGGIQRRFRTCSNPPPINAGKPCFGHPYQSRACSTRTCPVDGGYTMWSPWLPCDADCGGGVQERSRFCNNPVPHPRAKDCTILGPDKETRLCNVFPCNVSF